MNKALVDNSVLIVSLLSDAYVCRINNLKRSVQLANKALILARDAGSEPLIGKSLNHLSLFCMIMGEFNDCIKLANEAIAYFEVLKDERGIADAKYSIAGAYYKTDNYHLGLVYLMDCLKTYRKYGDYYNQARVEKSLGTIYEYFGDEKNAIATYENSIATAIKAGDVNLESNAYNPLSGIYLKQNDIPKALDIIERSIAIKQESGDTRGLGFALYGRGKVYLKLKRFNEAEIDFKRAIAIHNDAGDKLGLGMAYHKLSALYVEMHLIDKAKITVNIALAHSKQHNVAIIKFKCHYLLYQISKADGDAVKALEYLELYLAERETVINTQTHKAIENYELVTKMEALEKDAETQHEKAEIMEIKNRAERSAQVKQEFLSTMSHEIRTPLNAVITITALLKDRADAEDQQLLQSLKFASNNLLFIINDILDFTKLDTGKVQLEMRPCNFIQLLENIVHTYESLAREKGLNITLNVGTGVASNYQLDEIKLSQILGNLIGNAIKYTDRGMVEISVETTNSDEQCDVVEFRVADTGVGIPDSYFSEMFDSFSQPKSITTRKQGGSGLGLAIVKKLISLHGSEIKFTSTVGQGSVFYFELKFKRSGMPIETPPKRSIELKDKFVLLAEDNSINATVARKLLSNWGIISEHAKNGVEAVEKSKQKHFDYILMDIHMPEMNGYDATKYIRENENLNMQTPIFALTADITAENDDMYAPYFNGFLLKPIEIEKLYEALTNADVQLFNLH